MPELFPTRLRILKRLTEMLEEIQIANGYKHDMLGRVYRGRTLFGEETPVPMLSILEVPIPPDQRTSQVDNPVNVGPWDLIIQGFVDDDHLNPTDPAQLLQADVLKRLALEKKNAYDRSTGDCKLFGMGDTVTDLQIGVGVVRPPDADISSKAYFWVSVRLTVAESLDNPYDE